MNRECKFEAAFGGDALAVSGDREPRAGHPFDDDSQPRGLARQGVVKWFRSDRGYGFVALTDGGDAFLHLRALRAFGRETARSGAKVSVVVDEGPRGMHVTRVTDVDEVGAGTTGGSSSSGAGDRRRAHCDGSAAIELTGRVKWFDGVRGFGFVTSDDFGRDVFIHSSVLGAAGVARLDQGQPVTMRVIETPKGREAIEISF